MRFRQYLGLGAFIYFAVLIANLPASLLVSRLVPAGGPVVIEGVSGTVWNGAVSLIRVNREVLPPLRWQLVFTPLLRGRLGLDWQLGGGAEPVSGHGRLALGLGRRISLTATELRVPAARIAPYMRVPGLELAGDFSLHVDRFSAEGMKLTALAGVLTWNQGYLKSPYGQAEVGSQSVHVTGRPDGGIDGQLAELEGPMDLKGEFRWNPDGNYVCNGSVREQLPKSLAQFFQIFGRPDGKGRLDFHYQGLYKP